MDGNMIFWSYLLFQSIEVLDDDPNDEVESEKGPADDKHDKIQIVEQRGLVLRLLINLGNINSVLHDLLPPVESCLNVKIPVSPGVDSAQSELTTWKSAR